MQDVLKEKTAELALKANKLPGMAAQLEKDNIVGAASKALASVTEPDAKLSKKEETKKDDQTAQKVRSIAPISHGKF